MGDCVVIILSGALLATACGTLGCSKSFWLSLGLLMTLLAIEKSAVFLAGIWLGLPTQQQINSA